MKDIVRFAVIIGCTALVTSSCVHRPKPPKHGEERLTQLVPPLRREAADLEDVLRDIVDRAELPLEIAVCPALLRQKITLKTVKPISVQELLQGVAMRLDGTLELYTGHHSEVARPSLWCIGKTERFMTLARGERTQGQRPR